ncbi:MULTISPECIES: hypothetical protein [unclassified Nocardioides]|uniref:hypothetical protein n=1 Tax=unclassified Nocardioides TaxID=2615069 RepID=UPI0006F86332|nr:MULTISPECIES: hypothetical protein [unclassified Nocardioides]KRA30970.1 hypothetical protein ASD81_15840 [Nocardioides sp. Root614]KRA87591.1 hypothetical protein ASD84_16115 [Nocardioides sp. Root682]
MLVLAAASEPAGTPWLALLSAVGLGSVLSALITGSFLLAQSRRQEARDDTRLTNEAKARVEDREAARHYALEDHWRDARYDAHRKILRACQRLLVSAEWGDDDLDACRAVLWGALPDVQVLGSAEARDAVEELLEKFEDYADSSLSLQLGMSVTNPPPHGGEWHVKRCGKQEEARARLHASFERFLAIARQDLGIHFPAAG